MMRIYNVNWPFLLHFKMQGKILFSEFKDGQIVCGGFSKYYYGQFRDKGTRNRKIYDALVLGKPYSKANSGDFSAV